MDTLPTNVLCQHYSSRTGKFNTLEEAWLESGTGLTNSTTSSTDPKQSMKMKLKCSHSYNITKRGDDEFVPKIVDEDGTVTLLEITNSESEEYSSNEGSDSDSDNN